MTAKCSSCGLQFSSEFFADTCVTCLEKTKAAKLTEDEILDFLHAVEREEITLKSVSGWGYCGVPVFVASNGWQLGIFNDCDEWDYIEFIRTPDGKMFDFMPDAWNMTEGDLMPRLLCYELPEDKYPLWTEAPLLESE